MKLDDDGSLKQPLLPGNVVESLHAQETLLDLFALQDSARFASAVQDLTQTAPQELLALSRLYGEIEKQRCLSAEERCRFGFVLATQLTLFIDADSPDNAALDPLDKKHWRNVLQVIGTAALIDEIAYGVFQFSVTQKGLISLGIDPTTATFFSFVFTCGDFLGNITNVSPANDANSLLFATHQPLKRLWLQYLFHIVNTLSIVGSYLPGATPGCVALLQYLPDDMPATYFALAASAIGILTILPGVVYYLGFNMEGLHASFLAYEQWLSMSKKDGDFFRVAETLKKVIGITVYRALCFAFFSQAFLQALRITSPALTDIIFFVAGLTFVATALNVISARLLPTLAETLNSHFVLVRPFEVKQAQQAYSFFTPAQLAAMLINLTIASGYGIMLQAYTKTCESVAVQYLPPILLSLLIAANSLYVQRYVAIHTAALASISASDLKERIAALNVLSTVEPDTHSPLMSSHDDEEANVGLMTAMPEVLTEAVLTQATSMLKVSTPAVLTEAGSRQEASTPEAMKQQRLQTTRENFAWLASTFKNDYLVYMACIISVIGRLARIAGFFYFLQSLGELFFGGFSNQMLLGLCLAYAPDNLKNEWLLFAQGSIDMWAQKIAETFLVFLADQQRNPEQSFTAWCCTHPWALIKTYNKGFLAVDLQTDLAPAMKHRIAMLAPSTEAPAQGWQHVLGTLNHGLSSGQRLLESVHERVSVAYCC